MVNQERIRRIRAEKERRGWSAQRVADEALKNGDDIAPSTIKNIASPNGENMSFKESTLLIVERALGLTGEAPALSPKTEEFYQQTIRDQEAQLKECRRIDRLKNIAIGVLLAFYSVMLLIDRAFPDVGWYRVGGNSLGWFIKTLLVILFIAAALTFTVWRRKKK